MIMGSGARLIHQIDRNICLRELGWKKSTAYTMLKRLVEKGYAKNEKALSQLKFRAARLRRRRKHLCRREQFCRIVARLLVSFLGGKNNF